MKQLSFQVLQEASSDVQKRELSVYRGIDGGSIENPFLCF